MDTMIRSNYRPQHRIIRLSRPTLPTW
jgi:hypothetical protein